MQLSDRSKYPLDGNCQQKAVIYEDAVEAENIGTRAYIIGLCENEFKSRWYNNHKQSFKNENLINNNRTV